MSILIQTSDFDNEYVIPCPNAQVPKLQSIIDKIEKVEINQLLGTVLATSFFADASANSGVPVIATNLAIYNEIYLEERCYNDDNYSSGIKEMLLARVYFDWMSKVPQVPTNLGLKIVKTTVSEGATAVFPLLSVANLSTANYQVIQRYICENSTDYPDYKGVHKKFTSPY